jgi:drug/metabolite transporter (DMT)-like permease
VIFQRLDMITDSKPGPCRYSLRLPPSLLILLSAFTALDNDVKASRLFILTLAAMIAFAGNSLLCRFALKQTTIDPASFTFARLLSGAIALWLILEFRRRFMIERTVSPLFERGLTPEERVSPRPLIAGAEAGNWPSALALFAYAAAFSFAYVMLSAGTGALLLFGAVQATMIFWGWHKGERLHAIQLFGLAVAVTGLVVLLFPGLSSPPLRGSILMLTAGAAWGIYSLRGKAEKNPAAATTGNFLRAVPLAAALSIAFFPWSRVDSLGFGSAVLSGAITSGLGYVIWYTVLPGLKAASAATVQLSVPVLAAAGGILLLGETLTPRFFLASIAVLGGIALVVMTPWRLKHP